MKRWLRRIQVGLPDLINAGWYLWIWKYPLTSGGHLVAPMIGLLIADFLLNPIGVGLGILATSAISMSSAKRPGWSDAWLPMLLIAPIPLLFVVPIALQTGSSLSMLQVYATFLWSKFALLRIRRDDADRALDREAIVGFGGIAIWMVTLVIGLNTDAGRAGFDDEVMGTLKLDPETSDLFKHPWGGLFWGVLYFSGLASLKLAADHLLDRDR